MKVKTISFKNKSFKSFSLILFVSAIISTGTFAGRAANASAQSPRLSYPTWQRVHNVGFRVICEIETLTTKWLTGEW
jgi:hypothetical protein